MAVEYKGITEDVNDATRTSITMQIPSEAVEGDLLICYISKDDEPVILETGDYSNWNMLVNAGAGTGNALYIAWRIATAADVSGAVSWTWNGDSEDYYGCILCYGGADTTNPIHASNYTAQGTADAIPIAPSVAFTDLTAGSMVFQCFGADDNDVPYTVPSPLTSRFNNSISDTGGAGGDKTSAWESPTGFNDPDSKWSDETLAYDRNVGTHATNPIPTNSWGSYIELTHSALSCSKVRFWAIYNESTISQISLDVYYLSAWHNIYEGAFAHYEWVEKAIGSTQTVTAMRIKFYNNYSSTYNAQLKEANFFGTAEGSGETGIATFGMNAAEQWVAATVIIKAVAGAGIKNATGKASLTTSIINILNRGKIEDTSGKANIDTGIIIVLSQGIIRDATGKSPPATVVTTILSRGKTENVIGTASLTSNITIGISTTKRGAGKASLTTSIDTILSRGKIESVSGAASLNTQTAIILSRGQIENISGEAEITSLITTILSKGAIENASGKTSITSIVEGNINISKNVTGKASLTTSIITSLSRGVVENTSGKTSITTSLATILSQGKVENTSGEASITSIVTGKPIQRSGREYQRKDIHNDQPGHNIIPGEGREHKRGSQHNQHSDGNNKKS